MKVIASRLSPLIWLLSKNAEISKIQVGTTWWNENLPQKCLEMFEFRFNSLKMTPLPAQGFYLPKQGDENFSLQHQTSIPGANKSKERKQCDVNWKASKNLPCTTQRWKNFNSCLAVLLGKTKGVSKLAFCANCLVAILEDFEAYTVEQKSMEKKLRSLENVANNTHLETF